MRGNRIPLQVVASKAEYRLATTNPRDLEELAAARGQRDTQAPTPAIPIEPAALGTILAARRRGRPGAAAPTE